MKVGDGNIKLLDYEKPEDIILQVLRFTNTSAFIASQKLAQIFDTQGKSRIQSDAVIGAMIEDPKEKFNTLFTNNLEKDYLRMLVLNYISFNLQNINSKKSLVIYLLREGFHITWGDNFRLKTDYNNDKDADILDPKFRDEMMADNARINEMIETFVIYNKEQGSQAWSDFLNTIKKFSDEAGYPRKYENQEESIYDMSIRYQPRFIDQDVSNIRRTYYEFFDNVDDFEFFISCVNTYRGVVNTYFRPTEKELVKYFGIPESTYRDGRQRALALLMNTYKIDFLKEISGV
jgi:hypothetical protein